MKPLKLTPLIPTEAQEQSAVIDWWSRYAPAHGLDERLLIASANGAVLAGDAKHRAIQMARLKRSGLRVGIPDLFLAVQNDLFAGLWIELKRIGGKATPEQVEMADTLRRQGYCAILAEGASEAIRAITAYLGSTQPRRYGQSEPTQALPGHFVR
jgi:hypothetical protein